MNKNDTELVVFIYADGTTRILNINNVAHIVDTKRDNIKGVSIGCPGLLGAFIPRISVQDILQAIIDKHNTNALWAMVAVPKKNNVLED